MVDGGRIPALFAGLCDDAAVFPPGLAPLPDAVAAHDDHVSAWYADLVGPLVVAATALGELAEVLGERAAPLPVSVTLSGGPTRLDGVLKTVATLPVELDALEIAVPDGMGPDEVLAAIGGATAPVFVEIPRDDRRIPLLRSLSRTGHRAKFRTGGVRAELYPDETELAAAVRTAVEAGVPFKATAGLHHALRNTDPETGFEQHGFLNLLLATDAVLRADGDPEALLAERDGAVVASRLREWDADRAAAVRAGFTSFGTCSITDPLTELTGLGLLETPRGEA
ncbi:hypothetical protein [Amycolatopsis regifaucium]|uniref:Uncharacterized protein n=1 Tax=Amycolatopsis regifaucium TaxID=546365 RepID=A0A154MW67_9PSEU|nr:hypothetical protein [Amycolatopsis regifaucium]KZB88240.1 hypothetical protein AVL48_19975 [Amycolatopsis regifaucium]OKA11310.1 hypothetical protein ATP06_0200090 [Amycolatopsis regifaucium]SFH44995.1 hypothetical protein SAMN04489731_104245 [Amycolatopsis regifaucium]